MMRSLPIAVGLLVAWITAPSAQDPAKPPVPAPAPTPAPAAAAPVAADQSAAAPAPADVPGKPKPHPLEGVYTLRTRVLDGRPTVQPSQGYLCITGRHLFLHLAAPGSSADTVLLRSSVRSWVPKEAGTVQTTVRIGWATDDKGTIQFEQAGLQETRRIEPIRGGVRVTQDLRNWLDFERIE